ncbi:hypothetical protein VCSRO112_2333 [Vibrio cholerae]|nr:hypothetical protein VCSRO112_2333 [Vibrio cholerae]
MKLHFLLQRPPPRYWQVVPARLNKLLQQQPMLMRVLQIVLCQR